MGSRAGEADGGAPETAVRREVAGDEAAIYEVVREAFGRASEAEMVEQVRARGQAVLSLVASRGAQIVGHVLASPITLIPERHGSTGESDGSARGPAGPFLGIAPVSVAPAHQNQGVGSLLMREAVARCRHTGARALFVLGSLDYYSRFGFRTTHIGNEYGATDNFMALELVAGSLSGVEAQARYVSAFRE